MTKHIFLLLTLLGIVSCEKKVVLLDKIVSEIKKEYPGKVDASIIENGDSGRYVLIELTDTSKRNQLKYMPDVAYPIEQKILSSLNYTEKRSIESIKMVFMNDSKVYFRQDISLKDVLNTDSVRQASKCGLLPNYVRGTGMGLSINEISSSEFYRIAPKEISKMQRNSTKNSDSLEFILNSNFGHKFKHDSNCYTFISTQNQGIKFCREKNPTDNKDFEYFNLINKVDEFFIFEVSRYEDGEYWIFNSLTGKIFQSPGYPQFSYSRKYIYSVGMIDESVISIYKIEDDKGVIISFNKWNMRESYFINEEGIRFKLESVTCNKLEKYLDLHFN